MVYIEILCHVFRKTTVDGHLDYRVVITVDLAELLPFFEIVFLIHLELLFAADFVFAEHFLVLVLVWINHPV